MQLLETNIAAVHYDAPKAKPASHPVLRERVMSFKMFWNARHCLLKFLLEYTKVASQVSPKRQLAMTVGNLLEDVLEAIQRNKSKDECLEIIEHAVLGLKDWEREHVLGRLTSLLNRAQNLDKLQPPRSKTREIAKQFFGALPNGWRIPAKPDVVDYPAADADPAERIDICDVKSCGSLNDKIIAQLDFFGLAISLDEKSKHQNGEHQLPRAISLEPVLLGKQRDSSGQLIDAAQITPWEYDVSREPTRIAEIEAVTGTIEQAFARNEFPPTVGSECSVCDYKHLCPAMRIIHAPSQTSPKRSPA